MPDADPAIISLLYQAMRAPLGIEVHTSNPISLRNKCYPLRKADPDLAQLSFVVSPKDPDNILWIIKRPEETANA